MNYEGAGHSELFLRLKTPMSTNLLTSVFRVSSCTYGMENCFAWYG